MAEPIHTRGILHLNHDRSDVDASLVIQHTVMVAIATTREQHIAHLAQYTPEEIERLNAEMRRQRLL